MKTTDKPITKPAPETGRDAHRLTLRLPKPLFDVLFTEYYERRMAGETTLSMNTLILDKLKSTMA